jgi:outer membrane protein assembly factor BamD
MLMLFHYYLGDLFIFAFMLRIRAFYLGLFLAIAFIFGSCDPYQKVLKSSDLNYKMAKGKEYYNKEEYDKAITLFEEVLASLRGTKNFEELYYYYAYAQFGNQNYYMAAYHFNYISSNYPNFEKAAECEYMSAYCYYLLSPEFELDQTDTYKAIDEMQLFINNHPESERVTEANEIIDKLRAKLELKSVRGAELYYNIGDYKAAMVALKNTIKEFPDSKEADYVQFLIVKSNFELAMQSIPAKKSERLEETIANYSNFIDRFASSKYAPQAQKIYERSRAELEKIKSSNKS